MSWILKEQLGDRPVSYLREFVAIGPLCTQDEALAMRFARREEALLASSRHWALCSYEPVEVAEFAALPGGALVMTPQEAARYLIERVQRNTNWDDEDVLAAALMANSFGIPLFVCGRCDGAATVYDETQEMDVCDEHAEGSPNDLDPLKTVAEVLAEAGLDPAELRSERVQLQARLELAGELATALAELARGKAHLGACIYPPGGPCTRCTAVLDQRKARARQVLDRWHAPAMPPVGVDSPIGTDDTGEAQL